MSIIVVTNDKKIPKELNDFTVEKWSAKEFLENAYSDDGIDVEESLWYHTNILTEEVYNALKAFIENGIDIVYYRFDTDPAPNFDVEEAVLQDPEKPAGAESEAAPTPQTEVAPTAPEPEPQIEIVPPAPKINPEETISTRPGSNYPTAPQVPVQPQVVQPQVPVVQNPAPVEPEQPKPQVSDPFKFNIPQISIPGITTPAAPQAPVQPQAPQIVPQQPQIQQTPIVQQPVQPQVQVPVQQPIQQPVQNNERPNNSGMRIKIAGGDMFNGNNPVVNPESANQLEDITEVVPKSVENNGAEVIIFGSSKGGTGKTFTACMSAYQFAKDHPNLRVALADFDIIDGQVAITTNQVGPTVQDFYIDFVNGNKSFGDLSKYKATSAKFSRNIDFYLAPAQDIPEITNDNEFWRTIYNLLIKNYDVVFFDTGIDYMGKEPISELYKVADKIIITCNTSINSVKSIIKQLLTLSGKRANNIFDADDDILSRINIVLTRVSDDYEDVNNEVVNRLSKYAPIIAAFGNIDGLVYRVQWGGAWQLIDSQEDIVDNLRRITDLTSEDE